MLKKLYSKTRRRLELDGYDLDLSYITPRIIAMSFPDAGLNTLIRNDINEVERYLNEHHGRCYRMYNLTRDSYDRGARFNGHCVQIPLDDHTAPDLFTLLHTVEDMKQYLDGDVKNVVVIHCKAGKGRTGLFTCALLLKLGICDTAEAAIHRFAHARSTDGTATVENPSQVRYVEYVAYVLGHRLESQYTLRYLDDQGPKYAVRYVSVAPGSMSGYAVELFLDFHTGISGVETKRRQQHIQTLYEPESHVHVPPPHEPFGFDVMLVLRRGLTKIRAQFNMRLLSLFPGV